MPFALSHVEASEDWQTAAITCRREAERPGTEQIPKAPALKWQASPTTSANYKWNLQDQHLGEESRPKTTQKLVLKIEKSLKKGHFCEKCSKTSH